MPGTKLHFGLGRDPNSLRAPKPTVCDLAEVQLRLLTEALQTFVR